MHVHTVKFLVGPMGPLLQLPLGKIALKLLAGVAHVQACYSRTVNAAMITLPAGYFSQL